MNKETCGLKKLHKGFWLSLCAAVVALVCCVAVFAGVQAADASNLNIQLNNAGDGYVVVYCNPSASGALTIPETYNGKPVVEIGRDAFLNCADLTSITIPDSVKSIGWYAFSGCTGLTSITIPDSVTEIDWFAFANCTGLTTATIGKGVTKIDAGAFSGCTALTDVTIQRGTTKIGWSAFKGCTALTNVTISNTVSRIERYAFHNCSNLANVYYTNEASEWQKITIEEGNDCLTNATRPVATGAEFVNVQHNLYLEDLTTIGYHCEITPNGTVDKFGILIWTDDPNREVAVGTEGVQDKELNYNGGLYSAKSDGIYSQYLGVEHYAKPYVKIGDEYIYSPNVDIYTPVAYTESALETDNEKLKNATISLLNYGTYAQIYFAANDGGTVEEADKINNGLTGEEKILKWDDSLKVLPHDIPKDTVTGSSMNWTWYGTNLSLLDAIQMNMAITGDGIKGMCYWTEEKYNDLIAAGEELKKNNASGMLEIRVDGKYTIGKIKGIVAKEIGSVFYVCAYDEQGNLSKVRADSVAAYATRLMDSQKPTTTLAAKDLAKALLIYGNSAKTYFDSIE